MGANLGIEAITWVPDSYLVANGFVDESTGAAYNPVAYPGHGTGLFFVGIEGTGNIYGYALDHMTGGFQRVATIASGNAGVMGLEFDRDVGHLWAYCDNTCGNRSSMLRVGATAASRSSASTTRPGDAARFEQRRHRDRARERMRLGAKELLLERRQQLRRPRAAPGLDRLRAAAVAGNQGPRASGLGLPA